MAAGQLLFGEAARAKILKGIGTLAEAVRVTLGPRARTVGLEAAYGPPKIVKPAGAQRARGAGGRRSVIQ
jgi:chaperonin GroEL